MKKLTSITALMLTSILMVFSVNTMGQFWKKKNKEAPKTVKKSKPKPKKGAIQPY